MLVFFHLFWSSGRRFLQERAGMNLTDRLAYILAVICYAPLPAIAASPQTPAQKREPPPRVETVFSHPLPSLDGGHLIVKVVRVSYAPGESSSPHSHPCPVFGYVLQGAVRMQVQEPSASHPGPVTIYRAGESFYESPGGRHLVSANASQTQPAIFTATFVCDHSTPLTTPINSSSESHP